MTDAEIDALRWLNRHNGDGAFAVGGKGKALLAGGEIAPVMRRTWNSLQQQGVVEFYGGKSGRARCRITEQGQKAAA